MFIQILLDHGWCYILIIDMNWSKALEIHEAWKKAGSVPCRHSFKDSLESDDARYVGNYVCAVCGSHVPGLYRLSAAANIK